MATKKKAAPGAGKAKFGAKADFVRAQPASMSAKEVVEAAKKAGLTMSENHVYSVRSSAKKASASKGQMEVQGSRRGLRLRPRQEPWRRSSGRPSPSWAWPGPGRSSVRSRRRSPDNGDCPV